MKRRSVILIIALSLLAINHAAWLVTAQSDGPVDCVAARAYHIVYTGEIASTDQLACAIVVGIDSAVDFSWEVR